MKTYKTSVVLWKNESGNWFARYLEPLEILPDSLKSVCGVQRVKLLNDWESSLKIYLDRYQERFGSLTPVPPREFSLSEISFSVKPIQTYPGGRFPDFADVELTSLIAWRTDDSGEIFATLPLENIEFSVFPYEPLFETAKETLRRYYADRPQQEILLRSRIVEFAVETRTITLNKIQPRTAAEKILVGRTLTLLTVPVDREYRRRFFTRPFGRERESIELSELLQKNSNLILCGPTGCGKSTLLVDAIVRIRKWEDESASDSSKRTTFWLSNAQRLKSRVCWLGDLEAQLTKLFNDLAECEGVLYLENLAELLDNASSPYGSTAAFFVPFLEEKKIRVVGETTPETFRTLARTFPAFVDQFDVKKIEAMSEDAAATAMLDYTKSLATSRRKFQVETNVPQTVTSLYRRFFSGCAFPGPAFSFLRKSLQVGRRKKREIYTQNDVYVDFVRETGLPERLFHDEQTLTRREVEEALTQGVVGQPEAIRAATDAVLRFKAALNHPKKPIASFLFCGPTGVGKTQLVKTLAQYLFGSPRTTERRRSSEESNRRFLRLDMSEYQYYGTAARMIERSDDQPGPLIEHIRREPFSIILFDEIEKAAPDSFDLLMNLLDEGRLTDRIGRTFNFCNTIIVMTSNLGTTSSRASGFGDGESDEKSAARSRKAVADFFRPEFFNRIDELVVFHHLDAATCRVVTSMEIAALQKREGIAARRLQLVASESLIDRLTRDGFHPAYGARPLQREIEKTVVPPLARFLQETSTADATLRLDVSERNRSVTVAVID